MGRLEITKSFKHVIFMILNSFFATISDGFSKFSLTNLSASYVSLSSVTLINICAIVFFTFQTKTKTKQSELCNRYTYETKLLRNKIVIVIKTTTENECQLIDICCCCTIYLLYKLADFITCLHVQLIIGISVAIKKLHWFGSFVVLLDENCQLRFVIMSSASEISKKNMHVVSINLVCKMPIGM